MVRVLAALTLSMAIATAYSGTWVNTPYWVVALTCSHHSECFAASNGSYTPNLNAARHFDDPTKAEEFIDTLTMSIRDKSPQIQRPRLVCVTKPVNSVTIVGRGRVRIYKSGSVVSSVA
jgi:hypothetical protein